MPTRRSPEGGVPHENLVVLEGEREKRKREIMAEIHELQTRLLDQIEHREMQEAARTQPGILTVVDEMHKTMLDWTKFMLERAEIPLDEWEGFVRERSIG